MLITYFRLKVGRGEGKLDGDGVFDSVVVGMGLGMEMGLGIE